MTADAQGPLETLVEVDNSMQSPEVERCQASPPSASRHTKGGRVRTGCLVCRARKVKCDEQRPTCQKCARLKRSCVYGIPRRWASPPIEHSTLSGGLGDQADTAPDVDDQPSLDSVSPQPARQDFVMSATLAEDITLPSPSQHPTPGADFRVPSPVNAVHHDTHQQTGLALYETPRSERFEHTSQIIYLSTFMDWVAASQPPNASSFTYFVDIVDCPVLSATDRINWRRIKHHIACLGLEQAPVAEALLAAQALHRAQVDRLPMSHALSAYQAAMATFESICGNDMISFDVVLVIAFLICLCAVTIPNEDGPHVAALEGGFGARLKTWLTSRTCSLVSLRLCAWMQLLNSVSKHPGSIGLLTPPTLDLLYKYVKDVPSLPTAGFDTSPEHSLYDAVAAPLFAFYLKLQTMSDRVANVTHYRRSRSTPEDQAEVEELMAILKADLAQLWETRPAPLRLQPENVREHFSPQISEPLIALSAVCITTFHTETIVIGRILGDPPFPSEEARHALGQIRSIVNGDWNICNQDVGLNPGLVRPLFVYALESFNKSDSIWAADRLRQVKHPMSRGNFLASFIEAHGEAQRAQNRRVTMKYFCFRTFGVPLPYM